MTESVALTDIPTGLPTGGKPINLAQLQVEMTTAGLDVSEGLGMADDLQVIFTYAGALPVDFPAADVPLAQSTIDAHVAMREVTDDEYAAEFQNPATTADRRIQINSIINGLFPREQVPM